MHSSTDDILSHRIRPLIVAGVVTTVYPGLFLLGLQGIGILPHSPNAAGAQMELLVGTLLLALGVALAMLNDLAPACRPKRLALSLAGLHLVLAVLSAWQVLTSGVWPFGSFLGWAWIIVQATLAAGFFLSSLKVSGPEEPEAEEVLAQNGIARSWLQAPSAAAREERRRLARDLHDSIKQQIFSVKMSAAAAEARWDGDPAGARAALADIRRSAQAAMVEMQALLKQLRPETVVTEGLVEALREQAEALGYRTGAAAHFELGDLPGEERLSPRVREQLFRIAQEALSNVARHARARNVHVWFGTMKAEEAHLLMLRVRDDGQGFDTTATTDGMGLRNMRERAESLPAVMVLESSPGEGTELRIYVRLPAPEASLKENTLRQAFASERFDLLMPVLWATGAFEDAPLAFHSLLLVAVVVLLKSRKDLDRLTAEADPGSARALHQIRSFQRCFGFLTLSWWIMLLWPPAGGVDTVGEWTGLGLTTLLAAWALREAWIFLHWYREAPRDPRAGNFIVLAALLAFSLMGLLWILLQGDPGGVARIVLRTSGALCLAWWLWTLTKWGKGMANS